MFEFPNYINWIIAIISIVIFISVCVKVVDIKMEVDNIYRKYNTGTLDDCNIWWENCSFLITQHANLLAEYDRNLYLQCIKFRDSCTNIIFNSPDVTQEYIQEIIDDFNKKHISWKEELNAKAFINKVELETILKNLNSSHQLITLGLKNSSKIKLT